ncbi:uncharacterized protein LOC127424802 isoform X2 [Myxocyprinus asiaticus]|uniref:uncharacterized protein LOC127424802 isoform X2 n=1 Tax=Myxocyprinus asiaticus TaxID=70543 RepID=UPI0022232E92|nr:uncharacterized protein LOC127424802 isoform X2 [Myxocyprinus asiaticus]
MASVEGLTCQSGCGIQLVSKKGHLSRTPALHLLPTHAEDSLARFTLSSSSSSSTSMPDQTRVTPQPLEREREAENLPPRRPLKLAPLELLLEVRESQRQKIKSVQQDGKATKSDTRRGKTRGKNGPTKSPEHSPLSTIVEPHKTPKRTTGPFLNPVNQAKLGSDRSMAGHGQANPTVPLSHPPSLCQSRQTQVQSAHAQSERDFGQSAVPSKNQDAVKRRIRLQRTQRLEEDQSKSSSSAGGLSADEGKIVSAGPGKGQCTAEKALIEASCFLEKASWRNPQEPAEMESVDIGTLANLLKL